MAGFAPFLQESVMYLMKVIIPAVIVAAGLFICSVSVYGTPEYAKKEKKTCTQCHSKVVGSKAEMLKNLNATGTCYKNNDHSLAKCSTAK
jgi:hypothetical protein